MDVYSLNTILKNVELFKINTVFFTPVFQFESSFAVKPDLFNKFWKQNGQVTEVIQVCVKKIVTLLYKYILIICFGLVFN